MCFPGATEQYPWEEARTPPEQHLCTPHQQRTKLWHLVVGLLSWYWNTDCFTDCFSLDSCRLAGRLVFIRFLDCVQTWRWTAHRLLLGYSFPAVNKRLPKDRRRLGVTLIRRVVVNCLQKDWDYTKDCTLILDLLPGNRLMPAGMYTAGMTMCPWHTGKKFLTGHAEFVERN